MNFLKNKSILILLFFIYTSCSTQKKILDPALREPQNLAYQEAEVYASETTPTNGLDFNPVDVENNNTSIFNLICSEYKPADFKINDRVVTIFKGQFLSGNIHESYQNGSTLTIWSDYGNESNTKMQTRITRNSQDVSKALYCNGVSNKKVYGLFKVNNKYYTGHVREVFKNGAVRFVSDQFKEYFSTIDQSKLEIIGSKLKLKSVLFMHNNKNTKGQIRRVFENNTLLIKFEEGLLLRTLSEVQIQD